MEHLNKHYSPKSLQETVQEIKESQLELITQKDISSLVCKLKGQIDYRDSVKLSSEISDKLNNTLEDQSGLFLSALKARKKMVRQGKLQKPLRYLGSVGKLLLNATFVALPILSEQTLNNGVEAFEFVKELATGGLKDLIVDGFKDFDAIVEKIEKYATLETGLATAFYAGYWQLTKEAKHIWDKGIDRGLGSFSSHKITLPHKRESVATIVSSYERFGVSFNDDKGNAISAEQLKSTIESKVNQLTRRSNNNPNNNVKIANFLRATGAIDHDDFCDFLLIHTIKNIEHHGIDSEHTRLAASILPYIDSISEAFVKIYNFEDKKRTTLIIQDKLYDNIILSKGDYNELNGIMRKCFIRDNGGYLKSKADHKQIIKEFIVSSIASNDENSLDDIISVISGISNQLHELNLVDSRDIAEALHSFSIGATGDQDDLAITVAQMLGAEILTEINQSNDLLNNFNTRNNIKCSEHQDESLSHRIKVSL